MLQTVFLKPKGGLGNQLFQLAAAIAFKKKYNSSLFLYLTTNKHSLVDYRTLYSQTTAVNFEIFTEHTLTQTDAFEAWSPENFSTYNSITLDGYFQYYPTIEPVLEEVKANIKLPRLPQNNEYHNYAFLHIRRGDYLQYSHLHHVLPPLYYQTALSMLNSEKILVISDDIAWCKSQPWLSAYKILEEADEVKTLAIMASCNKGGIIANSSFSWWGAVLCGSSSIFYPSLWYSDVKPNLFPNGWTCIKI